MRAKRIVIAIGIAALLFAFSFALDVLMGRLSVPAASTYANNVLIGVVGAGLAYSWTTLLDEREERARERLNVIVQLNRHIRNSLSNISLAALAPDEQKRLGEIMGEIERIEWVLEEVVPTAMNSERRTALPGEPAD